MDQKNFNTILTHTGTHLRGMKMGIPKVPPMVMNCAYSYTDREALEASLRFENEDHDYGRCGNATNDMVRDIIAAADEAAGAQVYATGLGAILVTVTSQVQAGDHVIMSSIVFGGTFNQIVNQLSKRYGVEVSVVDFNEDLEPYFKPNTKLVYMETIANPTIVVQDIEKIAAQAHAHGAKLCVDNTFATPIVCQPLKHGADFAVYSATKFMNGHSDIMAGAVAIKNPEDVDKITRQGHVFGPTMSPFDAWLLMRSMRTLEVRMRTHCANAMKLAEYLKTNEKVLSVAYPGLKDDAGHEIANRLFNNGLYGGMVTIDLGTYENVMFTMDKFKYVQMIPSLGSYSTSFSDTRTSHSGMSAEDRAKCNIKDGLMRISVGLENVDDIIADFDRVLGML